MIAVLHSVEIPHRVLTSMLRNLRRQVEGPFRSWMGDDDDDQPWRLYKVPPGIESHYAAARLAGRRGARIILGIGQARAAAAWLEERPQATPRLEFISAAHDLRRLEPLQRLTPDSAKELPERLPTDAFKKVTASAAPEGAPIAGSLALPLTVPRLGEELYRKHDIGLFENSAAGLLEGAAIAGVCSAYVCWVRGPICFAHEEEQDSLPELQLLEEALAALLQSKEQIADMTTRSGVASD